jgi:hypothetical protein
MLVALYSLPPTLLNLLLCRALIKGIQGKFATHALCMHFWKTLCIKKVDLTHLLSPAIYPQIILYHHNHPYYKYHVLPKKIQPKKNVFCSIPFNIPKLPLENSFKN